jgi:hypothetical protein
LHRACLLIWPGARRFARGVLRSRRPQHFAHHLTRTLPAQIVFVASAGSLISLYCRSSCTAAVHALPQFMHCRRSCTAAIHALPQFMHCRVDLEHVRDGASSLGPIPVPPSSNSTPESLAHSASASARMSVMAHVHPGATEVQFDP